MLVKLVAMMLACGIGVAVAAPCPPAVKECSGTAACSAGEACLDGCCFAKLPPSVGLCAPEMPKCTATSGCPAGTSCSLLLGCCVRDAAPPSCLPGQVQCSASLQCTGKFETCINGCCELSGVPRPCLAAEKLCVIEKDCPLPTENCIAGCCRAVDMPVPGVCAPTQKQCNVLWDCLKTEVCVRGCCVPASAGECALGSTRCGGPADLPCFGSQACINGCCKPICKEPCNGASGSVCGKDGICLGGCCTPAPCDSAEISKCKMPHCDDGEVHWAPSRCACLECKCEPLLCDAHRRPCDKDSELVKEEGACCGKCVQKCPKCPLPLCMGEGIALVTPPERCACPTCQCKPETCPVQSCDKDSELVKEKGECCGKCVPKPCPKCPLPLCMGDGIALVTPPERCACPTCQCKPETCPVQSCDKDSELVKEKGECCGKCVPKPCPKCPLPLCMGDGIALVTPPVRCACPTCQCKPETCPIKTDAQCGPFGMLVKPGGACCGACVPKPCPKCNTKCPAGHIPVPTMVDGRCPCIKCKKVKLPFPFFR